MTLKEILERRGHVNLDPAFQVEYWSNVSFKGVVDTHAKNARMIAHLIERCAEFEQCVAVAQLERANQ